MCVPLVSEARHNKGNPNFFEEIIGNLPKLQGYQKESLCSRRKKNVSFNLRVDALNEVTKSFG